MHESSHNKVTRDRFELSDKHVLIKCVLEEDLTSNTDPCYFASM